MFVIYIFELGGGQCIACVQGIIFIIPDKKKLSILLTLFRIFCNRGDYRVVSGRGVWTQNNTNINGELCLSYQFIIQVYQVCLMPNLITLDRSEDRFSFMGFSSDKCAQCLRIGSSRVISVSVPQRARAHK